MVRLDLDELCKLHEDNRLEVKKALGGIPDSLWASYSAFANTNGGHILLGVEELKDGLGVVGLPEPEKLRQDFWNTIHNRQKVSVNILYDKHVKIVDTDDGRIIVIDIPRAGRNDRPVYLGNDPFKGSYRRNGEGDYRCTEAEVLGMFRDKADISQDLRVLGDFNLEALDGASIKRYRIKFGNTRPGHVWEKLDDLDFLQKLGAVGRGENGDLRPTAAGLLMFGFENEIVREFPNFFLDYQEHDDSTSRWTDRTYSASGDWSGNIFDFFYKIYGRLTDIVKTPFKLRNGVRVEDTPVHQAIREALVNALIHSDYAERRGLVVHRLRDEILIANPGGLRVSIADAISGGISDPRNVTLVKMFNLINFGERAGSGISGIFSVWVESGFEVPELFEEFNPDRTVLALRLKPGR